MILLTAFLFACLVVLMAIVVPHTLFSCVVVAVIIWLTLRIIESEEA